MLDIKTEGALKLKDDFDLKAIRKAVRESAKAIAKAARRNAARRAVSSAGEFPGRQTGRLMKAVKASTWIRKPSRDHEGGIYGKVQVDKTDEMPVYYPAFVIKGHRAPGADQRVIRGARGRILSQQGKKRKGTKVALPRKDPVIAAEQAYRQTWERALAQAMDEALKL